MDEESHGQLTQSIIGASIEVHRELGPGLLESVYEKALSFELAQLGLEHLRQVPIDVAYKGEKLDLGFRADLIVAGEVLVEIKSIETLLPVHSKQVITYLKLARLPVGLFINFNEMYLKEGLKRIVLGPHALNR